MSLSNYHTHTRYCDGKDSPEELVLEAIRLGCPQLGFSGHSYLPFTDWTMSEAGTAAYGQEIRQLQEKYRDRIKLYLGIEYDYYSELDTSPFDYVIGSVHFLHRDGCYLPVDESRADQITLVNEHYGGDFYSFVEDYYTTVAGVYEKTMCDIVGHFDLVTKFNEGGCLFDTSHPRYRKAALEAMDRLLEYPVIFEINTGAISRGYRTTPYPEPSLLRELEKRGAPLILSSDCHDKRNLLYGLEELQGSAKGIRPKLFMD
ncbi:MAG: histidinol-phosphatase [Oscillospiraceae bacterium]|nr:histidinol-phosphatase [Oscillospiraceae bacterium]